MITTSLLMAVLFGFGCVLALAMYWTVKEGHNIWPWTKSSEAEPQQEFEEITLERGEDKPAFVFRGRRIGRTPGGHIHVIEAEDGFYVITNGYLNPRGVYSFAFPSELKGHIRLTKEIIELFRELKNYNSEFGEVVEEKLENPLLKEFMTRKQEVPVKVISRRVEDGEVPNTQRNDAEVVQRAQGTVGEMEGTGS